MALFKFFVIFKCRTQKEAWNPYNYFLGENRTRWRTFHQAGPWWNPWWMHVRSCVTFKCGTNQECPLGWKVTMPWHSDTWARAALGPGCVFWPVLCELMAGPNFVWFQKDSVGWNKDKALGQPGHQQRVSATSSGCQGHTAIWKPGPPPALVLDLSWAGDSITLGFSFLMCKMGTMTPAPEHCCDISDIESLQRAFWEARGQQEALETMCPSQRGV